MKHHFPKPLISFRKLQGGQFGTLDVQATGPHDVQLALGNDFVQLTRGQWLSLRSSVDRFFGCETEVIVTAESERGGVIVEEREEEIEEEVVRPPPRAQARKSAPARRRTANG
jgi:hypothetical protein